MKLWLKHYFSTTRKEFEIALSGTPPAENGSGEKCCGFYAVLSHTTVGLAACEDRLYVMIDETVFEVDAALSVGYESEGQLNKLLISRGAEQYCVEFVNGFAPVTTPYFSEDEEDADFGLWLSNTLNSPDRQNQVLEFWTRGF